MTKYFKIKKKVKIRSFLFMGIDDIVFCHKKNMGSYNVLKD